jgi:hypothetical protein
MQTNSQSIIIIGENNNGDHYRNNDYDYNKQLMLPLKIHHHCNYYTIIITIIIIIIIIIQLIHNNSIQLTERQQYILQDYLPSILIIYSFSYETSSLIQLYTPHYLIQL